MKRKIRLTESELYRLIRRVISEQTTKQVTVTVDCTAKTLDTMAMTAPMITKYCTETKGTTTQTLAQEYKMTRKDQIILTRAELDSIGAFSAEVIIDSSDKVSGVSFKMKKELTNPSSMGGGIAQPFYSTADGAGQGTGRVAGGVTQIKPYVDAGVTTAEAVRKLGEKQAKASQSFK